MITETQFSLLHALLDSTDLAYLAMVVRARGDKGSGALCIVAPPSSTLVIYGLIVESTDETARPSVRHGWRPTALGIELQDAIIAKQTRETRL